MAVSHVFSSPVADATGTVTVWQGSTTASVAASDMIKPGNWNSAHNQYLTLAGNTAGASTVSGTNIVWAGGNNITMSANGSTVSMVGPTAAGTGTTFAGANVSGSMTLNTAGLNLSLSAEAAGGGATRNYFNPQDGFLQVTGAQGNASMHIQPMFAPNVTFDRLAMPLQFTNATNSTGSLTVSIGFAVYSRTGATLSMMHSTSGSQAITFSGTVGNSTYSGLRLFTMPWSSSFSEDQYYAGIWSRTTSGGANGTINQFLASQQNSTFAGFYGEVNNTTMQYTRGLGHFSATFSTALPGSVAFSQIRGVSSVVLRQPVFYVVNGTF